MENSENLKPGGKPVVKLFYLLNFKSFIIKTKQRSLENGLLCSSCLETEIFHPERSQLREERSTTKFLQENPEIVQIQ